MKKILLALSIVAMLLGGSMLVTTTGCNTPGAAAHKTEVVTIPTVDAAMTDWAAWVKKGNATQAQLDAVKSQYQKYYDAQVLAKTAILAYLKDQTDTNKSAMNSAVTLSATHAALVVTLIETYKTTKK